ncbi:putative phage tail protein [Geomicrobium sp. JCM 19037]|nr:putative phage tail protein [Geomicrobium sp. JCM 19037]
MIAAASSLDLGFFELVENSKKLAMIPNINEQDHDVLDHLAFTFSVDAYERSMGLETKRELISDAVFLHQTRGTPAAVERLITTLFNDGRVEEWWEYGGEPYMFRVITNNPSANQERALEFIRAVNAVKNMRSHLETVILEQMERMSLYWAGFVHQGDKILIR